MNKSYFDQFFAKSDGITTLEMHTRHVLCAGENLLSSLPLEEEERKQWKEKLVRVIVLHDLGKVHRYFINRLSGKSNVEIRHELVSLMFCCSYLSLEDDELFAVATHHKGIIDSLSGTKGILTNDHVNSYISYWYESDSQIFTQENIQTWLGIFDLKLNLKEQKPITLLPQRVKKYLNVKYQKRELETLESRKKFSLMRALLMAADHLGSARKENDIPTYKVLTTQDFQPKKDGKHLPFRPFQEKLQHISSDVVLHAPTGSGKTEAALNWILANQAENTRVYYLLPYTASINAMVHRLQKHYNEDVVTALHSKTIDFFYEQISGEYSNEERDYQAIEREAKNKKSLSKELFYPIKVATLHQILKTSLKGKGWEFALFDYKNALFIIDEFHTYDALTTGMLLATIKLYRKLFNAKFMFLSATIPDFMLELIINEIYNGDYSYLVRPDPAAEQDKVVLLRKRHQLYCMGNTTILEKINLIEHYLHEGKSVLIIVNNVRTAQELYNEINFEGLTQLLHSGFNRRDRTIIEKSITHENPSLRPQLLIATQAVEVSLDIDYDIAFIENAPIDALIQRFGRINRAGKKRIHPIDRSIELQNDTVPVYVFERSIGKTPFYNDQVLMDTWAELLLLNNSELGETDLITVCNSVYRNGYNEDQMKDFETGLTNSVINEFETDWVAGHWRDWVNDLLQQKNQKIEVLCFNLLEEYENKIGERRFLEANQLLVQVYNYDLEISIKRKTGDVLIANNLEYSPTIGYFKKLEDVNDQLL